VNRRCDWNRVDRRQEVHHVSDDRSSIWIGQPNSRRWVKVIVITASMNDAMEDSRPGGFSMNEGFIME